MEFETFCIDAVIDFLCTIFSLLILISVIKESSYFRKEKVASICVFAASLILFALSLCGVFGLFGS